MREPEHLASGHTPVAVQLLECLRRIARLCPCHCLRSTPACLLRSLQSASPLRHRIPQPCLPGLLLLLPAAASSSYASMHSLSRLRHSGFSARSMRCTGRRPCSRPAGARPAVAAMETPRPSSWICFCVLRRPAPHWWMWSSKRWRPPQPRSCSPWLRVLPAAGALPWSAPMTSKRQAISGPRSASCKL